MKSPLFYILLIFTALMLLSVVGGISLWFESVADTWTVEQTNILAVNFAQVLWYGGVVFVSVLGWYLFSLAPKPISRPRAGTTNQPQISYVTAEPSFSSAGAKALPAPAEDDGSWYEIEPVREEVSAH